MYRIAKVSIQPIYHDTIQSPICYEKIPLNDVVCISMLLP